MSVSSEVRNLLDEIGIAENFEVHAISHLAGGSINEVYYLSTTTGDKVLKLNKALLFPGMFNAEEQGLMELKNSHAFDVPQVYGCGTIRNFSYLLLEYKHEARMDPRYWKNFSENLAHLHQQTTESFGFTDSNYIGSLPQYNGSTTTAAEFYITQRLKPQFRIAKSKGYDFDQLEMAFKNISTEIPDEAPALVHGDLWSGNLITNEEGLPCLIDPAVSYAPREMDLAMMKLFGGFPEEVFQSYNEIFPLSPNFEKRIPMWQLYYLLVHLNIFGSSYLPSVKNILLSYS